MRPRRTRQPRGVMRRPAFRVWIASYGDWKPADVHDVPPDATAVEPAEQGVFSARRAAQYVSAFNRMAIARQLHVWAVALPVVVRYEGDPEAGQRLAFFGDVATLGRRPGVGPVAPVFQIELIRPNLGGTVFEPLFRAGNNGVFGVE